jgi:hypothetical protein
MRSIRRRLRTSMPTSLGELLRGAHPMIPEAVMVELRYTKRRPVQDADAARRPFHQPPARRGLRFRRTAAVPAGDDARID